MAKSLLCAICRFARNDDGTPAPRRTADYIWEGVSVCDQHLQERRTQIVIDQARAAGDLPIRANGPLP